MYILVELFLLLEYRFDGQLGEGGRGPPVP